MKKTKKSKKDSMEKKRSVSNAGLDVSDAIAQPAKRVSDQSSPPGHSTRS
jgi:hypothetical protein